MKFTVFALVAALCLVAVHAHSVAFVQLDDDMDFDVLPQDIDDDTLQSEELIVNIFDGFYWLLLKTLRLLKGVRCTIQGVYEIQATSRQFPSNVANCGGYVSSQVQAVINSVNSVGNTANDIINVNQNVCNTAGENNNSGKMTGLKCLYKLLGRLMTLKNQVKNTISLAKQIPASGNQSGACVIDVVQALTSTYSQFPSNVKSCSRLTS